MADISKLPRWARNEIEKLRADLASADQKVQHLTGETPSQVEIDPYGDGEHPRRFLRDHDTVRFHLGSRRHIDVQLYNGQLLLIADNTLLILPRAGNSALVTVEPRHA